jgi:CheY-like chemotaxis protein
MRGTGTVRPDRSSTNHGCGEGGDTLGEPPCAERSSVRVLVVDDQRIVRRAIRALLAGTPDLEVIGEADGGEAAVRRVARLRPHVVLMDLKMPGIGGTEAIRRIVQRGLQTRILVLTSFASAEDLGPALEAGANGCLSKESEPAALVRAIRQLAGRGPRRGLPRGHGDGGRRPRVGAAGRGECSASSRTAGGDNYSFRFVGAAAAGRASRCC